jgi:hypothetical protein
MVAGYPPCGQGFSGSALTSSGALQLQQPGHDVHAAVSAQQQHAIQGPHYFPPYTGSPQPTYSLPPSTAVSRASTPTVYSHPHYNNLLFFSLLAAWPMSGPMYPDAVNAYLQKQGPMPDLNAMQAQLVKVNADIAAGMYNLANPSIASPASIISHWTDGIDVTQIPWVKADPRYGAPLPPPGPLGALSTGFAGHQEELSIYNGIMM